MITLLKIECVTLGLGNPNLSKLTYFQTKTQTKTHKMTFVRCHEPGCKLAVQPNGKYFCFSHGNCVYNKKQHRKETFTRKMAEKKHTAKIMKMLKISVTK